MDNKNFQSFLVESGLISQERLAQIKKEATLQNIRFEKVLIDKQIISEADLTRAHAYFWGIPYIDLSGLKVEKETLNIIPESVAKKNNIIAYKQEGTSLEVAMLDPTDLSTLDFVKKQTGFSIKVRVTDANSLKSLLSQYQKSLKAEFGDIINITAEKNTDLNKAAQDLPIVKIVDTIIKHAILQGASDIHIETQETQLIIRYRLDGVLHDEMTLPQETIQGVIARIKVLSNLKLDEHRLPQDGRFKMITDDFKFSFRVSVLPVFEGEKIVIRLLDESGKNLTVDSLNFQTDVLETVNRNISKPNGIILVTGPTGSGKTTTLYTILGKLNTTNVNISTVEDPVEYRMKRVNQTQVNSKIGMTFASGLRALLRQDPNIIMVGEIRDQETATIAMQAALTGHLVLSTIHTNSAAGTVPRLLDMGIQSYLVASTLNVIIAQRLVRKLCVECKKEHVLKPGVLEGLSKVFNLAKIEATLKKRDLIKPSSSLAKTKFFEPIGCDKCRNEGYKGRVGVYEVLEVNDALIKVVTKATTDSLIQEQAEKSGMLTMVEDGFIKSVQGITTISEIMRVSQE